MKGWGVLARPILHRAAVRTIATTSETVAELDRGAHGGAGCAAEATAGEQPDWDGRNGKTRACAVRVKTPCAKSAKKSKRPRR